MTKGHKAQQARQIVDAAIELAERRSWEAVRLHQVAAHLGIGLDRIQAHFREKDELIDAWFDRADAAAVAQAESDGFARLPVRERLFVLIMGWLDALEPHRRVTRQMIQAKLEPGHVHIQLPAVMRISRTVQWMREAARLEDAGLQRALAESATTAIYLAAFTRWMGENAPGSPATRRLLDRLLRRAEAIVAACPFRPAGRDAVPDRPASGR